MAYLWAGVTDQLVVVNGAERNMRGRIASLEGVAEANGRRKMTLIFDEYGDLAEVHCRRSAWLYALLVGTILGAVGAVLSAT